MSKLEKTHVTEAKFMLHGGDYNPDQWLDRPDILADDIKLMKLSHTNTFSVGIFAWSALEPEEGVYQFEWLDDIFERIHSIGGRVILATPSGARPAWLSQTIRKFCASMPPASNSCTAEGTTTASHLKSTEKKHGTSTAY